MTKYINAKVNISEGQKEKLQLSNGKYSSGL